MHVNSVTGSWTSIHACTVFFFADNNNTYTVNGTHPNQLLLPPSVLVLLYFFTEGVNDTAAKCLGRLNYH